MLIRLNWKITVAVWNKLLVLYIHKKKKQNDLKFVGTFTSYNGNINRSSFYYAGERLMVKNSSVSNEPKNSSNK